MWDLGHILQLIQIGVIVFGGFVTIGSLKERLDTVDKKVDRLEAAFVQLARQDERISAMDQRMILSGKRIDRLEYARRPSKEKDEDS